MKRDTLTVFQKRKISYSIVFFSVMTIYVFSSFITEFKLIDGISSIPGAAMWMMQKFVPNAESLDKLPKILDKLFETVFLSIAVSVVSAIFAFIFSLLGSNTTKVNGIINRMVRMISALFRNVPDVVWAMLLMFSFGQNILTGFFALFFTTFGMLTRAFIETIDEVSASCVEALDATGANFIQKVFQGIIPSSIVGIITWVLYMIETNIRSSTLIGILTATGIGYQFDLYYKRLDYSTASLVVISIVVVVIAIELITNKVRKEIM